MEPGAKDQAIEYGLGLTSAAYYDKLLDVVASTIAYEHDPLTVMRVRSIIESPSDTDVAV